MALYRKIAREDDSQEKEEEEEEIKIWLNGHLVTAWRKRRKKMREERKKCRGEKRKRQKKRI